MVSDRQFSTGVNFQNAVEHYAVVIEKPRSRENEIPRPVPAHNDRLARQ